MQRRVPVLKAGAQPETLEEGSSDPNAIVVCRSDRPIRGADVRRMPLDSRPLRDILAEV